MADFDRSELQREAEHLHASPQSTRMALGDKDSVAHSVFPLSPEAFKGNQRISAGASHLLTPAGAIPTGRA